MDAAALRAEFPVLDRVAYLNAGTCGPLARATGEAAAREAASGLADGRGRAYFERTLELKTALRSAYGGVLGAEAADVALTTCTSEGIARVLAGLALGEGDEILVAEQEHPGLLGPVAAARARLGVAVRAVPLVDLAGAVGPRTRVVACSHVAWTDGSLAPALDGLGDDVAVLLDGAQGVGAVPVDVEALGCSFYAGSGQKWMCGPVGTGMLWISPRWRERVRAVGPTYINLADPSLGVEAEPWADARAFDTPALSAEAAAAALAAHDVLAAQRWPEVHARATTLAAQLARALAAAGREVAPRGESTLVSWVSPEPEAEVARLAEAGVLVRTFAGLPLIRASVGAWNDERDLDRLLSAAG